MGDFNRRFGGNLESLRIHAGMTREQLAGRLDMAVESLRKIESGLADTRLDMLEKIAAVLNVSYKSLLDV